jgi:hypothetical protein
MSPFPIETDTESNRFESRPATAASSWHGTTANRDGFTLAVPVGYWARFTLVAVSHLGAGQPSRCWCPFGQVPRTQSKHPSWTTRRMSQSWLQ